MNPSPAKRKRDDPASQPPLLPRPIHDDDAPRFTFSAPTLLDVHEDGDDGGSSPRTRVASRFGSLAIEERVHKRMREDDEDEAAQRKDEAASAAEVSAATATSVHIRMQDEAASASAPSVHIRMQDEAASASAAASAAAPHDPLRASLTWQDDEITVYDPNDKDDDGTGVNGIGFKPTPAIAHARALKRRQQLAEYRKREERDARARRSRRRPRMYNNRARDATTEAVSGPDTDKDEKENGDENAAEKDEADTDREETSTRRVRFLETGPVTIRFLEPEVAV